MYRESVTSGATVCLLCVHYLHIYCKYKTANSQIYNLPSARYTLVLLSAPSHPDTPHPSFHSDASSYSPLTQVLCPHPTQVTPHLPRYIPSALLLLRYTSSPSRFTILPPISTDTPPRLFSYSCAPSNPDTPPLPSSYLGTPLTQIPHLCLLLLGYPLSPSYPTSALLLLGYPLSPR